MNDSYSWWLFFVGLAAGIAGTWLLLGWVRRADDDMAADERAEESRWISTTIGRWGGDVPVEAVDQVLELHRRYSLGDAPLLAPDAPAPGASPSTGHDAAVDGDDAGRETLETHVRQPG